MEILSNISPCLSFTASAKKKFDYAIAALHSGISQAGKPS